MSGRRYAEFKTERNLAFRILDSESLYTLLTYNKEAVLYVLVAMILTSIFLIQSDSWRVSPHTENFTYLVSIPNSKYLSETFTCSPFKLLKFLICLIPRGKSLYKLLSEEASQKCQGGFQELPAGSWKGSRNPANHLPSRLSHWTLTFHCTFCIRLEWKEKRRPTQIRFQVLM